MRIVKPYYVSNEDFSMIVQAYSPKRARRIAALCSGEIENFYYLKAVEVRLCLPLSEREIGSQLS